MTVWTPRVVGRFLQLFADPSEYTYETIAEKLSTEFGVHVSKNAAIGIGKRLNVPQRKKPNATRKPEVRIEHRRLVALPPRRLPPPQSSIVRGTLRIDQLEHSSCRWPYGIDPPFLFCGETSVEGRPYCEEHMKLGCMRWQPTT